MELPYKTTSLCPACLRKLGATIEDRKGEVWITKRCPRHGLFEDKYWGDAAMFKRFAGWAHDGRGVRNPNITDKQIDCPRNCGLCRAHTSHTALANIVVTNRCDLKCFYCFFYASAMGYVYEPSLEQIGQMLRTLRAERPVPPNALQLTGGEPCLRADIVDIIRLTKAHGFDHVQLNTNGIRLGTEPGFAAAVRAAGVNTVYLSFDGTGPKTNPKNHWEIPGCLDNCRKAGIGVVLVPTIINTVNDSDVGNIFRFGLKHVDIIRGINYQPVSLVGRITKANVRKYRITIPEVIDRLEKQTNGVITKDDFYPITTVTPLTHLLETLTGQPKYELTSHFACGAATYIFKDGEKVVPIPRFVDVEGLMEYLQGRADELKAGKSKALTSLKIITNIGKFIDKSKQPAGFKLLPILKAVITRHDYRALGELHHRSLFLGLMHFQDLWNYDIERVRRCCIHYGQPDGRIVPFCAFNVIPQWYRDKIQKKYSVSIKEWEKTARKKLTDELYRRDAKALAATELYRQTYAGFV